MKIETAKILSEFICDKLQSCEFEQWVYSNSELEFELNEEIYSELISLNFNNKSIRITVKNLVEPFINYGILHKNLVIELIEKMTTKSIDPIKGIAELYSWANKGYHFVGSIELIGNYGEQGKSIIYSIDEIMTIESKWNKIIEVEPNFMGDLLSLRDKLKYGKIILTGEKEVIQFYGEQFKYEEN